MVIFFKIQILSIALALFFIPVYAQDINSCGGVASEEEVAFHEKEELTYAGNYTWGPIWTDVAEVVFKTRRIVGSPIRYYVRVDARTFKFYDTFFKVRDVYEASFEIPTMRPVHFYRYVQEGSYRMKNTFRFDWANNRMNATIQRKTYPARDTVLILKPCTFDAITFFYNARSMNFSNIQPNQIFTMDIVIDDEIHSVNFKFIKRETKKIKSIGKVNCLRFSVGVIAGEVFKGDERIDLWISDDKNHIPVFLETPIIVGKARARLTGYKNLKYPLNIAK